MSFTGKRILVTGAGSGIGKGISQELAARGARVVALSLLQSELDDLKRETPGIETLCVDLRDWQATRRAVQQVGLLDGLVNNAGLGITDKFLDVKCEDFDRSYEVNVRAVINVSQVVVQAMIDNNKPGSIVNISSQSAQAALEEHTVYCGTKAAVDMTTKVMALELGRHNIRVNAVNPTVVMTALGMAVWSDPAKSGPLLARIPLGRFADVSDVVKAVLFLLSDDAAMTTGATLPVDGGFLV